MFTRTHLRRRCFRTNGLAILFLVFFSCFWIIVGTSCRKREVSDQMRKVTVAQWGQEKYLIYLPFYVAMEKGFFSNEKLDVDIRFSGNDDQVFASVLQGGASFGIGDPIFTAIANEREKDLGYVVASIVHGVAIWGVTNKEGIPEIVSKKDLANLRVGTFPAPSTNFTLMKETIVSGGPDLQSTQIVQAPIGSQIALLERGVADIAMVLEPAASKAQAQGYRVVFSSPKFYGPFAFTGLTTSADFVRENPAVVQAMVNGLQQALMFCHSDPNGTIDIAQKLFPTLDRNVVERAVTRMLAEKTVPESVLVSEASWQAALGVRITVGDLNNPQEYLVSVRPSFARAAILKYRKVARDVSGNAQ